jgi:hypothetical protein
MAMVVIFRRLHNLDVDIAVSGFTKEQKDELEEVSSPVLLTIFLSITPKLSLFSTRRIYWREQRKKQRDWLATTLTTSPANHIHFSLIRQVGNGL